MPDDEITAHIHPKKYDQFYNDLLDNQLQGQIVDWFFLDMDYQKNTSNKAVNQRQPALTLFEDTLEILIIKNLEEFKHGMPQTRVNQLKSFFCMSLSIRINEYIANNIDDFQLLPTPQLVKIIEIEIMSYLNWLSTKSTYKFSASFSLTTATILQQVHQLATIMQYLLIADYHINNYRKKIKINAIHDLIENNHSESIIFSDFPNWLNSLGIRVAINYESHQLYFEVLNVLKKELLTDLVLNKGVPIQNSMTISEMMNNYIQELNFDLSNRMEIIAFNFFNTTDKGKQTDIIFRTISTIEYRFKSDQFKWITPLYPFRNDSESLFAQKIKQLIDFVP